jgi:hypothetical protein
MNLNMANLGNTPDILNRQKSIVKLVEKKIAVSNRY